MSDTPSIEAQIDCFLEQFKRSASKAMEERVTDRSVVGTDNFYLDVETPG